jgi:hypothetical protein
MTAQELRLKLATDDDLVFNCLVLIRRDIGFKGSASFRSFMMDLSTRIIKAHTSAHWSGPFLTPGQLRPARTAVLSYVDALADICSRHAEGIDWPGMRAGLQSTVAPAEAAEVEASPATAADFEEGPVSSVEDVTPRQEGPVSDEFPGERAAAEAASIKHFGSLENHKRQHPGDFRQGRIVLAREF